MVRRLPGLEEATLGRQTGHLLHHRSAVSCLLAGTDDRIEGGIRFREKGGGKEVKNEIIKEVQGKDTKEGRNLVFLKVN